MKKIIFSLLVFIASFSTMCFWDQAAVMTNPRGWDPNTEYVSGINLPWLRDYDYYWWNELLIIAKNIFNRALEYLPMLILILLLLACLKIIFDGDWKVWFKRIKSNKIWIR